MMRMYTGNYIQNCQGNSSIQQEEDSFHQQNRIKFKEETSKVLHLENNFVWCWNLKTSESVYEIPGKFGTCCWRRMNTIIWTDYGRNEEVLQSQRGEEYPTTHKKKEV